MRRYFAAWLPCKGVIVIPAQKVKNKRDTMRKSRRKADIKIEEADIRRGEWFGSVTAVLLIALSIFFMSGFLQNFWVLSFIQLLGILMNLAVCLVSLVRRNMFVTGLSLLLLLGEAVAIVYFILF